MARYNGNFVYGPSSLRPDYRDEPESSAPYPYMNPRSQYQLYQQLTYRRQSSAQYDHYDPHFQSQNYQQYEHSDDYQQHAHNDHDNQQEDLHFHYGRAAALARPIPIRLRVTICCEELKLKLEQGLNDLKGLHDVGIEGWANAMVSVTGRAAKMDILKKVWELSRSAKLWDKSHSIDACHSNSCHHRRHD